MCLDYETLPAQAALLLLTCMRFIPDCLARLCLPKERSEGWDLEGIKKDLVRKPLHTTPALGRSAMPTCAFTTSHPACAEAAALTAGALAQCVGGWVGGC